MIACIGHAVNLAAIAEAADLVLDNVRRGIGDEDDAATTLARFTLALADLWPLLDRLESIVPDEANYSDEDVNLAARAVVCAWQDANARMEKP